jgi:hypothetical protein
MSRKNSKGGKNNGKRKQQQTKTRDKVRKSKMKNKNVRIGSFEDATGTPPLLIDMKTARFPVSEEIAGDSIENL